VSSDDSLRDGPRRAAAAPRSDTTKAVRPPGESPVAEAVVVGASAGAIGALSAILPLLPRGFPLPIMVVVHVPADKRTLLAELFSTRCQLRAKEAEDKEALQPGTIYFAAPDYHLLVEPDRRLSLSNEEPVLFSRPSIDVLFESAADVYGAALIAIVLSGANADGAAGVRAVVKAGGRAWVQAPETAEVPTMPQAALVASPAARAFSLAELLRELIALAPAGKEGS
jgi:two-component system chemotaxis response regulator CheB